MNEYAKKVIVYPGVMFSRAWGSLDKFIRDKEEYNKGIGFNHGIIYLYEDQVMHYVYETKTAYVIRNNL